MYFTNILILLATFMLSKFYVIVLFVDTFYILLFVYNDTFV